MTTIAIYLFFVSALSSYRSSKYWPSEIKGIAWLGKFWWSLGGVILGTILLLIEKGWTIGFLLAFCVYMTVSCCIIFFASSNKLFRSIALILFHAMCIVGLILKF